MVLVLLLLALICFVLAAVGVPTGRINLVAVGLAFLTLAALVPSITALNA